MKKLIHLGIVAIFAITVSSCSQSTDDLVSQETETKEIPGSTGPNMGMNPNSPSEVVEGMTKIYPFVNQPFDLELGNPDSYMKDGEFVVIYVRLAPAFAIDPPSDAILTTKDDDAGEDIQSYNLISDKEADSYGLKIPSGLEGHPFMFAIVELTTPYLGLVVGLHSEITVNEETSVAHLDNAFTVIAN